LVLAHYGRIVARGWSDAWRTGHRQGLIAGFFVALLTAIAEGVGEQHVHVPHLIVAAALGFGAAMVVLIVGNLVLAPVRLFEEARAGRLTRADGDPQSLATEFSAWFDAKRAALPNRGWRQFSTLFPSPGVSPDTHAQLLRDNERRRDAIETVHAQARAEYQERFRSRVAAVLGDLPVVRNPGSIADLGKLRISLVQAAKGETPELLRTPIGDIHQSQLHKLLDALANAVRSGQRCEYGDLPDGDEHNKQALAAHFPDLASGLDEWDKAVMRRQTAPVVARERLKQGIENAEVPDGFGRETVAEAIGRMLVDRVEQGHPDASYKVVLRAVRDEHREGRWFWTVWLPNRLGSEVKVAEYADAPIEEIQASNQSNERALQAVVNELRDDGDLAEITESQATLEALRSPTLELLKLKRAVSPIFAADGCAFCQAQRQDRDSPLDARPDAAVVSSHQPA
jgi:hypothetical protein